MSNTRQPRFTPTTDSIPEENADSSSGGGSMLHSSMELLGRAIVAAESEKRVIRSKLLKKSMSKYKLLRLLSKFMLSSMTCSNMIIAAVADYCSEMTLHQLMTLGLLLYSSADKLRPLVAIVINKLSSAMLRFASDSTKSALARARASAAALLCSLLSKLMTKMNVLCSRSALIASSTFSIAAAQVSHATTPVTAILTPLIERRSRPGRDMGLEGPV